MPDLVLVDRLKEVRIGSIARFEGDVAALERMIEVGVLEGQRHRAHETHWSIEERRLVPEVPADGKGAKVLAEQTESLDVRSGVALFFQEYVKEIAAQAAGRIREPNQGLSVELHRLKLMIRERVKDPLAEFYLVPAAYLLHRCLTRRYDPEQLPTSGLERNRK